MSAAYGAIATLIFACGAAFVLWAVNDFRKWRK